MAINQIETGYKPEFGLGAMWAGENAANAEMANQLDFIKQFLANQREQQIQPLDVRVKDMEASRADVAKSPEMLDAYRRGYLGQADTQEAAGTKAKALLPFAIASERAKAEREGAEHGLFGNMYKGVAKQYDQSIPDNERIAAGQNAYALADTMSRVDPKTMAQERMLNGKLLSAEELMQLRLAQAAKLAEDKANAPKPPKTGEEALVRYWQGELAAGNITQDQYEQEVAAIFNRRTEKPVQSGITGSVDAQGNIQLGNKPNVAPYAPRAGSVKQSDEDLINKYLSK